MIIFLVVFIIVAYFIQKWSMKHALDGIAYQYVLSKQLVEQDEPVDIVSTLTNHAPRFVPFVRTEETLPAGVKILHEGAKVRKDLSGNMKYSLSTFLMPRSRLKRHLPISFSKRGCYVFRGANITGGDFLGLNEDKLPFHHDSEIVVYPQSAHFAKLPILLGGFIGDVSARRFIMEDPVLTIGVREYTGREPLNQISWKHSARSNRLMVKQFDYTMDPMVSVLLDVSMNEVDKELLEQCFSLTRTVCQFIEQKNIPYDFITNVGSARGIRRHYVSEGLGKAHLGDVLEILGRASYQAVEPLPITVEKLAKKQERSRSTVIITPCRNEEKQQQMLSLQELVGTTPIFIYGEDSNDIYNRTETNL